MKMLKDTLFLLPALGIAFAALTGFRNNAPVFPAIAYPEAVEEQTTAAAKQQVAEKEEQTEQKEAQTTKHKTFVLPKSTKVVPAKQTVQKKKIRKTTGGQPADGTFTGSAVCDRFYYTMKLQVKFKGGKAVSISNLQVVGNEDPANQAYWEKAWKPMVQRILKAQNADVDVVSGATYSSRAVSEAYEEAYEKAVQANGGVVKKSKTAKKTEKKTTKGNNKKAEPIEDVTQEIPTGTVTDGTYHVSADCVPDEDKEFEAYVLSADVRFADGKLASIENYTATDESNQSFYLKAANGTSRYKGVVAQLIEKQSPKGINVVSGATCSSKTIRDLYLKALTQATGVEQEIPEETMEPTTVMAEQTTAGENLAGEEQGTSEQESIPATLLELCDGTYTASAMVLADEDEEFLDYTLTADVTFSGGYLVSIGNMSLSDPTNLIYCNRAANGTKNSTGVIEQMIQKQSSKVDIVSGATCSSVALKQIFENALEMAKQAAKDQETESAEE